MSALSVSVLGVFFVGDIQKFVSMKIECSRCLVDEQVLEADSCIALRELMLADINAYTAAAVLAKSA